MINKNLYDAKIEINLSSNNQIDLERIFRFEKKIYKKK